MEKQYHSIFFLTKNRITVSVPILLRKWCSLKDISRDTEFILEERKKYANLIMKWSIEEGTDSSIINITYRG